MIAAALALSLIGAPAVAAQDPPANAPQVTISRGLELRNPEGGASRLLLMIPTSRLPQPQLSPKQGWMFEWVVNAFALRTEPTTGHRLRFRVFSQFRKTEQDPAEVIGRLLIRLWDYNDLRLGRDHAAEVGRRVVDAYVCFGGPRGGEQLFEMIDEGGRKSPRNNLYFYDVLGVPSRLELVRLVSRVYAEGTLPPWQAGEDRELNRELGEKLYMTWLARDVSVGRLAEADAASATRADLERFVEREVRPLVRRGAERGPAMLTAEGSSSEGFVATALYADAILPVETLGRALSRVPTDRPSRLVEELATEVGRRDETFIRIPLGFEERPLWIPVGEGQVFGGTVVRSERGWSLVDPRPGPLRVVRVNR